MVSPIRLSFDVDGAGPVALPVDGEHLMESLLAKGVDILSCDVDGVGTQPIPVADDAIFLADAVNDLGALEEEGGVHHVYLADGALEVRGTRRGDSVAIVLRHTPHLNRALSAEHESVVSLERYRAAWLRIVGALLAMVSPAAEPGDQPDS